MAFAADLVDQTVRRHEEAHARHHGHIGFGIDLVEQDPAVTDTAFAAAQRWRFQHLFVDEFQDVNPLQLRLLDAWRGDRYDLCVVGDPHQAIYGWNGADAGFLQGFRRLYPPAEVISLVGNYRSTPQVLAAAADVLSRAGLGESRVTATRVEGPAVRPLS